MRRQLSIFAQFYATLEYNLLCQELPIPFFQVFLSVLFLVKNFDHSF